MSLNWSFQIDDNEIATAQKRYGSVQTELRMLSAMKESLDTIQIDLIAATPKFSGLTQSYILIALTGTPINMTGEVGTNYIVSMVREVGRAPGSQPPYQVLQTWTAAKIGDMRLAYVIARAIGRNGSPALHIFQNVARSGLAKVSKIWTKWLM